jgi:hypothetical protein
MVLLSPSSSMSNYASSQFSVHSCPLVSLDTNKCDAVSG